MKRFYYIIVLPVFFLIGLLSCQTGNKSKKVKQDDSFDTAHVAVVYVPADHQDSLLKANHVEYRWFIHEKNEDSTVELFNTEGKLTERLTFDETRKLRNEEQFIYNSINVLIEIKKKKNGKPEYKRVFDREDTLKKLEYLLDLTDHDTISKEKYQYNEKHQLIKKQDLIGPQFSTEYKYWPNGLLRKETYYLHDSLIGSMHYRYNHKGHLRETQGTNGSSYLYEKRLYDDHGRLRERSSSGSFMGIRIQEAFIYNYNEKDLCKRIGYLKDIKAPLKAGENFKQDIHGSEVTYIRYKYRNEP